MYWIRVVIYVRLEKPVVIDENMLINNYGNQIILLIQ